MMATFIIYYIYAFSFLVLMYLYYRVNRQLNDRRFSCTKQIVYLNKRHLLANLVMATAIMASAFQPGTDISYLFFNWNADYAVFTICLFFLAFTISIFSAKNENNKNFNEAIGVEKVFYLVIRLVFLIVYELYFRVILLQAFNFLPLTYSVIINIILYSAAHAYSGKKEMTGSVLFGLVLCLLTILHQSVWPAVILHMVLCLPYESMMLYSKNLNKKIIAI